MSFLDKLERVFGRMAVPNVSLYLVIGQVAFVLANLMQLPIAAEERLIFWPGALLMGEWWRLFTFMFVVDMPSTVMGYVFLVFKWSLFYMMGSALEGHWGAFRFNLFLLMGGLLTIAVSFVTVRYPIDNDFILGSVFLAFAYLYPNYEINLYGILPVKTKWLALIMLGFWAYYFIVGGLPTRLQICAVGANFFLFFGGDMLRTARHGQRTRARQAERVAREEAPRHVCHVCGKTDKSHPELDFRYCSKCAGDQCYCPEHIQNHSHVGSVDEGQKG